MTYTIKHHVAFSQRWSFPHLIDTVQGTVVTSFSYFGTVQSNRASFIHAARTLVAKCLSAISSFLQVLLHVTIDNELICTIR